MASFDQRVGGHRHGRARPLDRPGPAGDAAAGHQVGVAVDDLDAVEGDAGAVAHQHGPRRVVALAVRASSRCARAATVGTQLDGSVLGTGDTGGAVDEGGQPDAELDRVAGGAPSGLLGAELVVPGGGEGGVEAELIATAVVGEPGRRLPREGVGRYQVAAAHLGGIETDSRRELVDGALDDVGRFGPAGASVGGDGRGVGDDRRGELLPVDEFVQGMLLALAGGVVGLVTASWASQALVAGMGTVLPFAISFDVSTDYRVVAATFTFCALATIGFGLWPALRMTRPDLLTSLKDQAGEVSGRLAGRITVRGALVTSQLALSLALLVLSGLFVRGAVAGASADPGFKLEPLVIAEIDPRLGGYDTVKSQEVQRTVLERLRALPGIASASAASVLPFGEYTMNSRVQREGPRLRNEDPAARGKLVMALEYTIGAGYFSTLGVPMLRGREFTAAEEVGIGGTPPVIIDAALAARLFPTDDPIGQVLQFGADARGPDARAMEIVGVAPTIRHDLFAREAEEHIYLPSGGSQATRMFVYARAASARRRRRDGYRARAAAHHRPRHAGQLRPQLPVTTREQRDGVDAASRRADVSDAWPRRRLRRCGRTLWRAQLPGVAPHP